MHVEIFTLCDAAADYQGRLSILGVFDTIFAPQLPAAHPQCAVALRIRFSRVEAGRHRLTLHIVDDDANMVIPPLQGEFEIQLKPNDRQATANLVLNLQGLQLLKYGEYAVNLAIDGREEASVPFFVRQPE